MEVVNKLTFDEGVCRVAPFSLIYIVTLLGFVALKNKYTDFRNNCMQRMKEYLKLRRQKIISPWLRYMH